MNGPRYAIYFAPEQHDPLARFGAAALGYDAETGWEVEQPALDGVSAQSWRAWTAEPRRYGFHATLKAPFRLREGRTESEFLTAVSDFALRSRAFSFDLRLASIGGFTALVPVTPPAELADIEREIVEAFDPFRAPLSERDLARRLASPLTPRQRASLDRYGYPYVNEEFRFHMTLSCRLGDDDRQAVLSALGSLLARMAPSPRARIFSLCVFRQDASDGSFRIVFRAPMN